ncbi:unnamed protein product [Pieris brassicae]|uniref:Uncharacterized protein n=1 Tax=Pieris brassicae TaxID=7116 RepID=A0A9P0XIM9_PIEBR|nr:unnamed protein product [Pieris brassicae]
MRTYQTNTVSRKLHIITKFLSHNSTCRLVYPKSDTCATCDDEYKSNYYSAVEAMQVDRRKLTPDTSTFDGFTTNHAITKTNNIKSVLLASIVVSQSRYSCLSCEAKKKSYVVPELKMLRIAAVPKLRAHS